jgi:hypothetical protein
MAKVFIVYKTDVHHSYDSFDMLGVSTTLSGAVGMCSRHARTKEKATIVKEQLTLLEKILQTQGYSGGGEFFIQPISTDILL